MGESPPRKEIATTSSEDTLVDVVSIVSLPSTGAASSQISATVTKVADNDDDITNGIGNNSSSHTPSPATNKGENGKTKIPSSEAEADNHVPASKKNKAQKWKKRVSANKKKKKRAASASSTIAETETTTADDSAVDNNNDSNNDNDNDNDNNNEMVLKFTGDISLDGGGFSSVRRRTDLDLSDYTGVVVTLRAADVPASTSTSTSTADIPPPTGLHLQLGDATSYYDFSSALAIPLSNGGDDVWTSVYLPMESFDRGTRFGFVCNNCQFDSSNINNLSVYVLFQEGSFDVRIRSIQAVKEPVVFRSPRLDFASATEITDLLRATVASGGGLYDKSYTELCVAMYWSVLNSLLTATAVGQSGGDDNAFVVPDSVGAVICAGLQQTENTLFSSLSSSETTSNQQQQQQNKHSAAAWTLRYTIEAVVADLKGIDRPNMNMGNNGDWLPSPTAAESMDATCVGRTSPAPGILFDPVVGTNDNENANADNDDNDNDESIPVSYDDDNDDAVEGINVTTTAMNDPSATAVANANVNTNSNNGNVDTVIGVAAAITSTSGASVSSHEHRTRFDLVSLALWTLLLVAVVA